MFNKTEKEIMKNWVGDINNPLVSIKCITYNHELYICDALESFLMQETTFPFEVIVHDDASTDNTANIIREYEKKYSNIIKPIYETENQYSKHDGSLSKKINSKIKGKYIAFCEGDDYWTNCNKLEKQVSFLDNNKDYIGVGHMARSIDRNGNNVKTFIDSKPGEYTIKDNSNWQLFAHVSSWLFRYSFIDIINESYSDFYKLQLPGDRIIPLLLLNKGRLFVLSDCYSIYRYQSSENSYTSKIENSIIAKIYQEYETLENYAVSNNINVNYSIPKRRALVVAFTKLIKLKDYNSFFIILNKRKKYLTDIIYCIYTEFIIMLRKIGKHE